MRIPKAASPGHGHYCAINLGTGRVQILGTVKKDPLTKRGG